MSGLRSGYLVPTDVLALFDSINQGDYLVGEVCGVQVKVSRIVDAVTLDFNLGACLIKRVTVFGPPVFAYLKEMLLLVRSLSSVPFSELPLWVNHEDELAKFLARRRLSGEWGI